MLGAEILNFVGSQNESEILPGDAFAILDSPDLTVTFVFHRATSLLFHYLIVFLRAAIQTN